MKLHIGLLFTVLAFFSAASAGTVETIRGFGDLTSFRTGAKTEIAESGTVFRFNTTECSAVWNAPLQTRESLLKPDTFYLVEFRYRTSGKTVMFPIVVNCRPPFAVSQPCWDTLTGKLFASETWNPVSLRFRTGSLPGYTLKIMTCGKFKGEITDFSLREFPDAVTIQAIASPDAKPCAENLGSLPTGSEPFTVALPEKTGGAVVRATDFGFAETNPDNAVALHAALNQCRKIKAAGLELAPGIYRMGNRTRFIIEGWKDFDLDGKGATLLFRCPPEETDYRIKIMRNERTRIHDLKLDWDWEFDPLASIVEVTGVRPGAIDFRFTEYDRFPFRDLYIAAVNRFDPQNRRIGVEGGMRLLGQIRADRQPRVRYEWLPDNEVRVFGIDTELVRPGQLYRMQHKYYGASMILSRENTHLTLQNIDILSSAGHALVSGLDSYLRLDHFRITPPENSRRVISACADSLHFSNSLGHILIENCEVSGGCDDALNFHCHTLVTRKGGPRTLLYPGNYELPKVGQAVELRFGDFFPAAAGKIVAVSKRNDGTSKITLDVEVPDARTSNGVLLLFNKLYSGNNVIIRNCIFRDHGCYAARIQVSDVTIENCRFSNSELGAFRITTCYTLDRWAEGHGASNIVLRNNVFEAANNSGRGIQNGFVRANSIGPYINDDQSSEPVGYPIVRDILFEGNRFINTFGLACVIQDAQNVIFKSNIFIDDQARNVELGYRCGFFISHAAGIKLVDNLFVESRFRGVPVAMTTPGDTEDLLVLGNRIVREPPALPALTRRNCGASGN